MKKLILIIFLLSTNAFAQYSGNNGIVVEYNLYQNTGYVSVLDWNATNDSTVNSTTAIQNAIASADTHNLPVFFPPGNYTSSALTVPDSIIIIGYGAKLNYLAGQSGNLLTLAGNCKIFGLTMDGGAYSYDSTTAEGNRTAINLTSATRCQFLAISVKGFSEKGIEASNSDFCILTNSFFKDNFYSIYLAGGAEYWSISNSVTQDGKYGVFVGGGNNQFTSCTFESAVYGAYVVQGSNGAHGGFTGCTFNHNTSANLYVTGMDLPEMFVSCAFYSGRVWVINSEGFGMGWCQFGTVDIIVDNADGMLKDCIINQSVTFTELSAGTMGVSGNINQDGSPVDWND